MFAIYDCALTISNASVTDYAYTNSVSLTGVCLTTNVNSMGLNAFESSSITSVLISSTVSTIGISSFINSRNLSSVIIAPSLFDNYRETAFTSSAIFTIYDCALTISNASVTDYAYTSKWGLVYKPIFVSSFTLHLVLMIVGSVSLSVVCLTTNVNSIGLNAFQSSSTTSVLISS
eukprot:gene33196-42925_t